MSLTVLMWGILSGLTLIFVILWIIGIKSKQDDLVTIGYVCIIIVAILGWIALGINIPTGSTIEDCKAGKVTITRTPNNLIASYNDKDQLFSDIYMYNNVDSTTTWKIKTTYNMYHIKQTTTLIPVYKTK